MNRTLHAFVLVFGVAMPWAAAAQTPASFDHGDDAGTVEASARVVGSNPASLGLVDGVSLQLDHALQLRSQSFEADGESAETFKFQSNPSVAFSSDLGTERFRVGFVGSLPRRYGSAWPSDGPQRYDSIFHRVRDIQMTAGGSFSPIDWLHVGASVSFVQAEYRSYRSVDMAPIVAGDEGVDSEDAPREKRGNEGREFLDFSGRSFGWSAGVTATPGDFRVGAAYHGPVPLEMEGNYELYIPQNDYYEQRYGGDIGRDATFETDWPGHLEAGVGYDFGPKASGFAHVKWTHWSAVGARELDVGTSDSDEEFDRRTPQDWNDTVDLRVGGEYVLRSWLTLDGSVGAGTTPIPAEQLTARILETPQALASVGAQWTFADGVQLRTGYQHVQYFPRTTEPTPDQRGRPGTYGQTLGLLETSLAFTFE